MHLQIPCFFRLFVFVLVNMSQIEGIYILYMFQMYSVFVFTEFIKQVRKVKDDAAACLVFVYTHSLYLLFFISCICFKMYFVFVFTEFIGQVRKVQDDAAASLCHRWAPHPPRQALILKTLPALLLCICIYISTIRICLFVYFDIFSTHSYSIS